MQPTAIHFGAGNIGRGFIGPLLADSGYHVIFADVNSALIDSINSLDHYTVHILSHHRRRSSITDFSGHVSNSPDLLHEFVKVDLITTSVGAQILPKIAPTIAAGLKKKREQNPEGLVDIIACENGVGASDILKQEVEKLFGDDATPEEQKYLKENVGFANCSVDRIVPPFDPKTVQSDSKDNCDLDVGVEDFYEWVVDQDALKTDHSISGMKLAKNLLAYVERKLFTLNTAHATISYLGYMKGYKTINEAIEDEHIYTMVRGALDESGAALLKKHSNFSQEEHTRYIDTILEERLKNPNVKDEIKRVCRAPKRKLGRTDRLVGPAMLVYEYDLGDAYHLVHGIAAAIHYDGESDEDAQEIQKIVKEKGVAGVLREVSGLKEGDEKSDKLVKQVQQVYDKLQEDLK